MTRRKEEAEAFETRGALGRHCPHEQAEALGAGIGAAQQALLETLGRVDPKETKQGGTGHREARRRVLGDGQERRAVRQRQRLENDRQVRLARPLGIEPRFTHAAALPCFVACHNHVRRHR